MNKEQIEKARKLLTEMREARERLKSINDAVYRVTRNDVVADEMIVRKYIGYAIGSLEESMGRYEQLIAKCEKFLAPDLETVPSFRISNHHGIKCVGGWITMLHYPIISSNGYRDEPDGRNFYHIIDCVDAVQQVLDGRLSEDIVNTMSIGIGCDHGISVKSCVNFKNKYPKIWDYLLTYKQRNADKIANK